MEFKVSQPAKATGTARGRHPTNARELALWRAQQKAGATRQREEATLQAFTVAFFMTVELVMKFLPRGRGPGYGLPVAACHVALMRANRAFVAALAAGSFEKHGHDVRRHLDDAMDFLDIEAEHGERSPEDAQEIHRGVAQASEVLMRWWRLELSRTGREWLLGI